jgi:hypothetical protein
VKQVDGEQILNVIHKKDMHRSESISADFDFSQNRVLVQYDGNHAEHSHDMSGTGTAVPAATGFRVRPMNKMVSLFLFLFVRVLCMSIGMVFEWLSAYVPTLTAGLSNLMLTFSVHVNLIFSYVR